MTGKMSPTMEQCQQCFMCCEQNLEKLIFNSEEICKRFCVLVSRFLDFNFDSVEAERTLNKFKNTRAGENSLICCRSCVPFIESFCVDYYQLTRVKLELTSNLRWILQILNLCLKKNNESTEQPREFRTQLQKQCLHFFNKKNFPFVKLERQKISCKIESTYPEQNESEPCIKFPIKLEYGDFGVQNESKDDDYDDIVHSIEVEIDQHQQQEPPLSNLSDLQTHDDDDVDMVTVDPHPEPKNAKVTTNENLRMDSSGETEPQSHSNSSTNINEKFKCHACGKEFRNIAQYSLHRRIVHKPKDLMSVSFKCDHCDERFSSRMECDAHQQLDCRHQTVTLQQVMAQFHMDRNAEIQAINHESTIKSTQKANNPTENSDAFSCQCGICGKSFSTVKILKSHERKVHSNIRRHECRFCEKRFKEKGHRIDHEMIHTGFRPFKCLKCDSAFRTKTDFTRHLQAIHNTTQVPSEMEKLRPHIPMPTQPMSNFARKNKLLLAMITSSLPLEDLHSVTSQKPENQTKLQKYKKRNDPTPETDNDETFSVPRSLSSTTITSNGEITNRDALIDFEESPVYLVKPDLDN